MTETCISRDSSKSEIRIWPIDKFLNFRYTLKSCGFPGELLKILIPRAHFHLTTSEPLGVEPRHLYF